MLTFLIAILMIAAVALFVLKRLKIIDIPGLTDKRISLTFFVALFLMFMNMVTVFSREGHQYYILSPTGNRSTITTPGVKFVMPFSKIQEWEKYIDIKCFAPDSSDDRDRKREGVDGVIEGGIGVRFIDKVDAKVFVSVRFEIPRDEAAFIKLVETYRHPSNLVNNTLIPTVSEQLKNVTFMYSAEDYVSGSATDYRMNVEDALKNGGFVVRKVEVRDTILAEQLIPHDSVVKTPRAIKEIRVMTRNEKVIDPAKGIAKRIQHEITANQIITAQVIIEEVDLNDSFERKLAQQRDLSAETIIEAEKVKKARITQQRVIAEGESTKAEERVAQEREQVAKLIAIETQVKEEESKRQLSVIALQTAEQQAKSIRVLADAKAYENAKLVSAGLTPQERAKIEKETAIAVAEAFSKMQTPQVMIIGGKDGKDAGSLTNSLIQAEMAKKLLNKQ